MVDATPISPASPQNQNIFLLSDGLVRHQSADYELSTRAYILKRAFYAFLLNVCLQPGWVFQKFGIPEGLTKDHRRGETFYNHNQTK